MVTKFPVHYWVTVCKTVRPMLSDHCLSCLSVTLVYCAKTIGWIKVPLGTDVGLSGGHIVLDWVPGLPMDKGTAAPPLSWFTDAGSLRLYKLRSMSIVAKRLHGSGCHLVRR